MAIKAIAPPGASPPLGWRPISRPVKNTRPRVARVIARLNVGGPAHHVTTLTQRLGEHGFPSELLVGTTSPDEASFQTVIEASGVAPREVPHLSPEIRPVEDLRALCALVRILRELRPEIVHTHTAKAGALGRIAALAVRPRPLIVHTYHGHVLEGYFGRAVTAGYRLVERILARVSDRLVAVSDATVEDLVRLGVAPRERFVVIRLGFDLDELLALPEKRDDEARAALGVGAEDIVLTFVGRLAPIKRVDVLLHAVADAVAAVPQLRLLVVGDGALRGDLEATADTLGIADRVSFLGFRYDLASIAAATDIAVLSSDNEGTPVALIEAAAAARPAVSTDVGGVGEIVRPDSGRLVPRGDAAAMSRALVELATDPALRRVLGQAAREHVRERYRSDRLVADVATLYDELLAARSARGR